MTIDYDADTFRDRYLEWLKTDPQEARHYGPGPHKGTGTPQSVHGHGHGTGTRWRDKGPIFEALRHGEVTDVQALGLPLGFPSANQRFIWKGKAGGVPVIIKTAGVQKELAAQEANDLANGLVSLPVMVGRSAPHGSPAIYMEFLAGDAAMRLPYHSTASDKTAFFGDVLDSIGQAELHDLDVFDALIGNYDRSRANMLIDNGRVHAIDHGRAMSDLAFLPWWEGQPRWEGSSIFSGKPALEPRHYDALNLFKENLRKGGRARLERHSSPTAVNLAVKRANWMLANGRIWRNYPLDNIGVDA